MELRPIVSYLDSYLDLAAYSDDSLNGLQVENRGSVTKVGLAVDVCQEAIGRAKDAGCNLLIVHHGLLWGKQQPLIYHYLDCVRSLIEADMALYAAHLPLDGHPEVGHNIQIAGAMGLQSIEPFAQHMGRPLGVRGRLPQLLACQEASRRMHEVIGGCTGFLAFGPSMVSSVAVVEALYSS